MDYLFFDTHCRDRIGFLRSVYMIIYNFGLQWSMSKTAQLWQKEASNESPKSTKVMFLDWICIFYF